MLNFHPPLIEGVVPCEEPLLIRAHTPSAGLAESTVRALQCRFRDYGHLPSNEMWTAIRAVAAYLENQANGCAENAIHVSSLDPGVGKTQTVVEFLRVLLASPDHQDRSALVCVSRLNQIEAVVAAAELSPVAFAVLTANDRLNALGCADPKDARVLFTTHQMVLKRSLGANFSEVFDFHYRRRPREVRIWDEAILPGECLTISHYEVAALLDPLSRLSPLLARDLDRLLSAIREAKSGTQFDLPALGERHGFSAAEVVAVLPEKRRDVAAQVVTTLWKLFGRIVTVRSDGREGMAVLDYEETLPPGLAPVLVLDASARVRRTYELWELRGGVVRLPPATKDYSNLTIGVWNRGGGKQSFRDHGPELIDAIATTIRTRPSEPWLVIHHKGVTKGPFADHVRCLLPPGTRVEFLNWGAHDATNDFADVPNVILAGTLFYPESHYEALGRLAARRPSSEGPFEPSERRLVEIGEHRHLLLQAICRGAIRKSVGAGCPETRAYVIASAKSGIPRALRRVFPGAAIVRWRPVGRALSGKVKAAVEYLDQRFAEDRKTDVLMNEVMVAVGVPDRPNFRKLVRKHPDFLEEIAERGIIERSVGRRQAFSFGPGWFDDEECPAEKSQSLLDDID